MFAWGSYWQMGKSMDDCVVSDLLRSYALGAISRSAAMQRLGIDWYGDLLVMVNQHGLPRPQLSEADLLVMNAIVMRVFDGDGRNGG